MYSFNFYNPTEIIFENHAIDRVGMKLKEYSRNILIVCSNSAKKYHYLDGVCAQLKSLNIEYNILDGICSNPTLSKVYDGVNICKHKRIDFIVGIGGASVIDTVKSISVASRSNKDIWELVCEPTKIKDAIPFAVIVTLFGSGSEMNNGAVITNEKIGKKRGFDSVYMFPKFSILDANLLLTVPDRYLIAGIVDMLVHVLERYFELPDYENSLSDDFCEALLRDIIKNSDKKNLKSITSLNRLLWDSTLAQNNFLTVNRNTKGEWVSHIISHEFCAKYNCIHGEIVGVLFLSWLNFIKSNVKLRSKRLLNNVFFNENTDDIVVALKNLLKYLGAPVSLYDLNIEKVDLEVIARKSLTGKQLGKYRKLNDNDVLEILQNC